MIFAQAEEGFRYTEAEAKMLAKLATVRVRADTGNRAAKAQIAGIARKAKALARRRDVRSQRLLRVLQESGILEPSQVIDAG